MIFFAIIAATVTLTGYVSAQTGLCPQPSGDFPNPSSEQCTTFFRCVQGQPNLLRCPANQRFDFLFRICRPQAQVDCNNQLQIYAAPSSDDSPATGQGAIGGGLGSAGLGDGGLLGGLGAGLPQSGLVNFLLNRQGADGDGGNNNQIALIAALGQMMNQRRAAAARVAVQQQQQQQQQQQRQRNPAGGFFNQQVVPLYNPGGPFVPPPLPQLPLQNNLNGLPVRPLIAGGNNAFGTQPAFGQPGFGPNVPLTSFLGGQPIVPGTAAGRQTYNAGGNSNSNTGLGQFNPVQLQNLIDLASAAQLQVDADADNNNNDDGDGNIR